MTEKDLQIQELKAENWKSKERLTKSDKSKYVHCNIVDGCTGMCGSCKRNTEIRQKLKEYEDLEEQGLLLKLPCKVGETVYQITRNFISEFRIKSIIQYDNGNIHFDWQCTKGIYIKVTGFHIDDIGKNVFLAKSEAEQALEKMKGE